MFGTSRVVTMYHAHALPNETLNFTAFFVVFGQRSLV